MSDSNVGLGMVPCKKNCRCHDCQIDRKNKRIADLEQKLEAAEKVNRLGTSLSASAAKDEDESGSILGYVLYVPPWLLYDFNTALAAFEEKG